VANEEHELSEDAAPATGNAPRGLARVLWPRGLSRGRKIGIAVGAGCLAALALVSAIGSANGSTGKPAPPAPAKSLTLPALGRPGATVSLGQYRGRAVVVNFFASWCVPCKQETPLLARFYKAQHGRVAIIGVDVNDGAASAEKFTRSAGVTYPLGTDPAGLNAIRWGVVGIPQTFFLNPSHHIVKRVFGAVTLADLNSGLARMRAG
jgi:cytochrome c biogenesis protein CcmG/thiol:disulfide interchange protein DsbE